MGDLPINFDEPEHVRMLRASVSRFVEAEMPREKAREWDRGNIYPREVMAKLADMGLMGLTVERLVQYAEGQYRRSSEARCVRIER